MRHDRSGVRTARPLIPQRLAAFCDDAAIFPPGNLPLARAIPEHLAHAAADHGALVGPLVLSAQAVADLGPHVAGLAPGSLPVSLTVPGPAALGRALARAARTPAVRLVSVEVPVPAEVGAAEVVPLIEAALSRWWPGEAGRPTAYVEIPRDERRSELLAVLAGSKHRAKFRTGGVSADLYPGEAELAGAIAAAVAHGVPFKATAGLHHAIRNTDPRTGFEQHGFLNLLLATDAALLGRPADALATILADRDAAGIARAVADLPVDRARAARAAFVSFGTCSIAEPLAELTELGLIEA